MKFMWVGDLLGNRYFEKAAINLPVKIQGIPNLVKLKYFTFQFDTGADLYMVYGHSVEPYLNLYPKIKQKLNSFSRFTTLKGIELVIDNQPFKDRALLYNKEFGTKISIDSAKSNTVKQSPFYHTPKLVSRNVSTNY